MEPFREENLTVIRHQSLPTARIEEHEYAMLSKYQIIVFAYNNDFAKYGCTIECGLMWKIFPSDTTLFSRIPPCRGYNSYVYCMVTKAGAPVNIPAFDGEVDYYPLSCCWQIVSISSSPFSHESTLLTSVDDVSTDIEDILATLRAYFGD